LGNARDRCWQELTTGGCAANQAVLDEQRGGHGGLCARVLGRGEAHTGWLRHGWHDTGWLRHGWLVPHLSS
jgi:hypothetical protein